MENAAGKFLRRRGLLFQQLFQGCQLEADGQHFHCLLQVFHRGQAGSNAQMVVIGVEAIGVGSTGGGQHHTSIPAQAPDPLCGTGHGVQADKVAALGIHPTGKAQLLDFLIQPAGNTGELGGHDGGMALD